MVVMLPIPIPIRTWYTFDLVVVLYVGPTIATFPYHYLFSLYVYVNT